MPKIPASPKVKIDVTTEIIDASMMRDSTHCMIAEAIKTAVPDAKHISVDLATIRFTDPKKGLRYTYLTPRIAQIQLVNFDQGRKPEPFKFQIRSAHITRRDRDKENMKRKNLSDSERLRQQEAGRALHDNLKKASLQRSSGSGGNSVPDRIGGQTPPLQRNTDGLPFSRRRAFGIRGLEY